MENQHKKIKGYRDLSQAEIDLMNEIKEKSLEIETLLQKVSAHVDGQFESENQDDLDRLKKADPKKWADWAASGFQNNFMMLVRAVAQPTSF